MGSHFAIGAPSFLEPILILVGIGMFTGATIHRQDDEKQRHGSSQPIPVGHLSWGPVRSGISVNHSQHCPFWYPFTNKPQKQKGCQISNSTYLWMDKILNRQSVGARLCTGCRTCIRLTDPGGSSQVFLGLSFQLGPPVVPFYQLFWGGFPY